jgi:very-short-patch-repair endonuclease
MALRRRKVARETLGRYALEAAGRAGSARLRSLVQLAEPAESPMETRLRWLFIENRLSRPQVQTDLRDDRGHLLGRADLYFPSARLVIEFDGRNHKDRLVSDNRRQNVILGAGYQMLRFTTADLRDRPEVIVEQVRSALASRRHV